MIDAEYFEALTEKEDHKFERIPESDKLSPHQDLCAILYIAQLLGDKAGDIISGASHDTIYFDYDPYSDDFNEDQAIYLARCGVFWDSDNDCLAKFV
jgi:hypothetical protein